MQIKIDLKIFLFLLIFFLTNQIEIYLLFMIFAIIHELGHLVTGIILGFKPQKISIIPMGLSLCFQISDNEYLFNKKSTKILALKKLLIALAGPMTNFFIIIFFVFFNIETLEYSREKIIFVNFLIGVFNLFPIYPLDGGRIIKCLVNIKKNLLDSYKFTYLISNLTLICLTVISSFAVLYLKNIAIFFIIIYLWIIRIRENIIYNKKMQLYTAISKYNTL